MIIIRTMNYWEQWPSDVPFQELKDRLNINMLIPFPKPLGTNVMLVDEDGIPKRLSINYLASLIAGVPPSMPIFGDVVLLDRIEYEEMMK